MSAVFFQLGHFRGEMVGLLKAENRPQVTIQLGESKESMYNEIMLKACLQEINKEEPKPAEVVQAKVGKASFYSTTGCLGCSPTLTMANGEKLDDTKLTVAYNHAPLNSFIKITNTLNGKSVTAKVTDRGGFEKHGKIVDLSVATKEALNCGSTCLVKVEHE